MDNNPRLLLTEEIDIIERFAANDADAEGLLAYSLHRLSMLEFYKNFQRVNERLPNPDEEKVFLCGELVEKRIKSYKENARQLISSSQASPPTTPSFFLSFLDGKKNKNIKSSADINKSNPNTPVLWKGLAWRLFLLLLATIAIAFWIRLWLNLHPI